MNRTLDWDGCVNVRDLGGLSVVDGRRVRRGVVIRADALDRLTIAGWSALWAHGVRTVIDLRNDSEVGLDAARRPAALTSIRLPLDAIEDRDFWDYWSAYPRFGTPLYFAAHLERFPERTARVLCAITHAQPGGVAIHCGLGRDRTGLISLVLLALAEVNHADIAADYTASVQCLRPHWERSGEDQDAAIDEHLLDEGISRHDVILSLLANGRRSRPAPHRRLRGRRR